MHVSRALGSAKFLGFVMAESQEAFEKAGAGYQKPTLRSDLRLVYENPATGKGQVRVIDPQGGRQFVFDENEQYLCRLADGKLDLKEIYVQLVADRGDVMTPAQVVEFYRRLHILGLLSSAITVSSSSVPAPAPLPLRPQGAIRGRGPAQRGGLALPAPSDAAPRESATSRLAAKRSQAAAAAAAAAAGTAGPAMAALPMPAPHDPSGPSVPDEQGSDAGQEVISAADAYLSDPILAAPPRAAEPAALVPVPPLASALASALAVVPVALASSLAPSATARDTGAAAAPAEASSKRSGGLRALLGGRRTADAANLAGPLPTGKIGTEPPTQPNATVQMDEAAADIDPEEASFDLSDIDFYDDEISRPGIGGGMAGGMGAMGGAMGGGMRGQGGGMGGGMRGGMGGMGAGMGGMRGQGGGMGGGMPGGMGGGMGAGMGGMRGQGGGMGGGMPGGMGGMGGGMRGGMGGGGMPGGMGAMGGMRGGMGGMGGGMPGGMGGFNQMQQPAKPFKKKPWQLPLFNPTILLRALYYLLYPMKYAVWLLLPAVIFSGMVMMTHYQEFAFDFTATVSNFGTLGELAVALFIVNLFARLAQGVALIAYGGKVRYIGATLALGMFPHICIDKHDAPTLDRTGQMWVHGSTLVMRLFLFCAGIIFWEVSRQSGTLMSEMAIMTSKTALAMFVATAWPLMPSDGMRLMATALNEPKLQPKAVMTFKYLFMGGRLPPFISKQELPLLTLFAVGALLTGVAFLGFLAITGFLGVQSWGGTGMVIWLVYCLSFSLWIAAVLRASKKGANGKSQPGFDRSVMNLLAFDGDQVPVLDEEADAEAIADTEVNPTRHAGRVWLLIALAGLAVAFLPYNYDTGGQVSILPKERGQAVARTDGEILKILVRDGDEVTVGQPVAVLSSWDQVSQISIVQAQLDGANASLAKLLAGSTPEEIGVARAKVVSAEADLAYTQAQADRARNLVTTGAMSISDKEKAESALASVLADLEVAKASLVQTMAPATQSDIDIDQANIDKLVQQLNFDKDELTRTTVVSPVAGHIVTQDMTLKIGTYLKSGDMLMEVEQTDVVTANIDVPEGDAPFLSIGRPVRLKLQGFSDTIFPGVVVAVAPSAETQSYGQTVQVIVNFPNVDGKMVSGMTGYAKIEGAPMRVWEAYLRTIKRFFQIQVWSWIP